VSDPKGEKSDDKGASDYNLFHLIADLSAALAWPITVVLLFAVIANNANNILESVNRFMLTKQSVELQAGPKEGLLIKIVAREVESGLNQQTAKQGGHATEDQKADYNKVASSAASQIVPQVLRKPETIVKVLWVDDHPENNIGLQYAFQALGMVVIAIDSDDGINESFATTGGFDVVITDMARDGLHGKPDQNNAGLNTISIIRANHPEVPVVVYAGSYAAEHQNDPLQPPVIAITNDTQRVFTIVKDIAAKKR
jgi:CheY-like chemotaxis protein